MSLFFSACAAAPANSATEFNPLSPAVGTSKGPESDNGSGTGDHVLWGPVESSGSSSPGSEVHFKGKKQARLDQAGRILCVEESGSSHTNLEESEPSRSLPNSSGGSAENAEEAAIDDVVPEGPSSQPSPLDASPEGLLLSVGSAQHASGQCTPCSFITVQPKGCRFGINCVYCHYDHGLAMTKPKNRPRPAKGQRLRYRKQLETLMNQVDLNPHEFDPESVTLPPSLENNAKWKSKAIDKLLQHKAKAQEALAAVEEGREGAQSSSSTQC